MKICKECGYELEDDEIECPNCGEVFAESEEKNIKKIDDDKNNKKTEKDIEKNIEKEEEKREETKTGKMLARCNVTGFEVEINEGETEFYCEDCQEEHSIDGEMYVAINLEKEEKIEEIEEKRKKREEQKEKNLKTEKKFEEEALYLLFRGNETEFIKIPKTGGTVGRYGDYGAKFFNERYMQTVSGEHLKIDYRGGDWIIEHLSKTNDTEVNGEKMEYESPIILKDGFKITLAKRIVFTVRIRS
ncbi:FHA domain-containing protein [Leptotrichia sp. oral taxon 218]|uniref:FHA domain-containing protein n=1 Tax=Leptotrichia sp. oral taxon 218 TaxID=712361 RepID=UPI001B8B4F5D|nr:FHA domain-containing protein [Leptotrichia sp. oral taxon 218]QUB95583.1 FHA domain-containing protein [Leptotrichia sp. oral taxon 218]